MVMLLAESCQDDQTMWGVWEMCVLPVCHLLVVLQGICCTIKSNNAPPSPSWGLHRFLLLHPPCDQCWHDVPWQEQCPFA